MELKYPIELFRFIVVYILVFCILSLQFGEIPFAITGDFIIESDIGVSDGHDGHFRWKTVSA